MNNPKRAQAERIMRYAWEKWGDAVGQKVFKHVLMYGERPSPELVARWLDEEFNK